MDQTIALMRDGYRWLPELRRRRGADVVETRLLGRRVTCLVGPEAARLVDRAVAALARVVHGR